MGFLPTRRIRTRIRAAYPFCNRNAEHSRRYSLPKDTKIGGILKNIAKMLAVSKKSRNFVRRKWKWQKKDTSGTLQSPFDHNLERPIYIIRWIETTDNKQKLHCLWQQTQVNKGKTCAETLKIRYKVGLCSIFYPKLKKIFDFICKFSDLCLYLHRKCGSSSEKLWKIERICDKKEVLFLIVFY